MATKIEWTNETWNIITGCNKASEGCNIVLRNQCTADKQVFRGRINEQITG